MTHLTLTTFGTLRVALDGTPITSFATDKVRALLVYLAVEDARPHHRETLAHLLWPDLPEALPHVLWRTFVRVLPVTIGQVGDTAR